MEKFENEIADKQKQGNERLNKICPKMAIGSKEERQREQAKYIQDVSHNRQCFKSAVWIVGQWPACRPRDRKVAGSHSAPIGCWSTQIRLIKLDRSQKTVTKSQFSDEYGQALGNTYLGTYCSFVLRFETVFENSLSLSLSTMPVFHIKSFSKTDSSERTSSNP